MPLSAKCATQSIIETFRVAVIEISLLVKQKTSALLINWLPKPNLSLQISFLLVLPPRIMIFGVKLRHSYD